MMLYWVERFISFSEEWKELKWFCSIDGILENLNMGLFKMYIKGFVWKNFVVLCIGLMLVFMFFLLF